MTERSSSKTKLTKSRKLQGRKTSCKEGSVFKHLRNLTDKQVLLQWNPSFQETGFVFPMKARVLNRWKEHFSSQLNRTTPPIVADEILRRSPSLATKVDDFPTDPFNVFEIRSAMNRLKNNKAYGAHTAYMFRVAEIYGPSHAHSSADSLFCFLGNGGHSGRLAKRSRHLHYERGKAGESNCTNYRGIAHSLSNWGTLRLMVLPERYRNIIRRIWTIRTSRFYVRAIDHRANIYSPSSSRENQRVSTESIRIAFVEFRAAFDSIDRDALYGVSWSSSACQINTADSLKHSITKQTAASNVNSRWSPFFHNSYRGLSKVVPLHPNCSTSS